MNFSMFSAFRSLTCVCDLQTSALDEIFYYIACRFVCQQLFFDFVHISLNVISSSSCACPLSCDSLSILPNLSLPVNTFCRFFVVFCFFVFYIYKPEIFKFLLKILCQSFLKMSQKIHNISTVKAVLLSVCNG